MRATGDITGLLHRWRNGSSEAESELFTMVLPDLRRLAGYLIYRNHQRQSLQPTELVDQIYLKLVNARDRDWQNRRHFFALAARAMRHHLIDRARGRPRAEFLAMEEMEGLLRAQSANLDVAITVDRLLEELTKINPEWCTLVELKYFLGFSNEEAAEALGMKIRTLERMWFEARKWMFERMEHQGAAQSAG